MHGLTTSSAQGQSALYSITLDTLEHCGQTTKAEKAFGSTVTFSDVSFSYPDRRTYDLLDPLILKSLVSTSLSVTNHNGVTTA